MFVVWNDRRQVCAGCCGASGSADQSAGSGYPLPLSVCARLSRSEGQPTASLLAAAGEAILRLLLYCEHYCAPASLGINAAPIPACTCVEITGLLFRVPLAGHVL